MMEYEIHFGLELPFWLALRQGSYDVMQSGIVHKFNLSNTVDRVDVGDHYLGQGSMGRRWVEAEHGEYTRSQLQRLNPTMPITRHAAKTVITHVRKLTCTDDTAAIAMYEANRDVWHEETLRTANRLIEVFVLLTPDARGQAGPIASWDIGHVIVSLWESCDSPPCRQVAGLQVFVRNELPAPEPISEQDEHLVRIALRDGVEFSIVDGIHAEAAAKIVRGRWRDAIVDDVTALELEVATFVGLQLKGSVLPDDVLEYVAGARFTDQVKWVKSLGGPALVEEQQLWQNVVKARKIRQRVTHWGEQASLEEAEFVHRTADEFINRIKGPAARTGTS